MAKIIGVTVGTTMNPQSVIDKSAQAEQIAKNTEDISKLSEEIEDLKQNNGTGDGTGTGADGQDGKDGVSPIATVTETEDGVEISITDINGTTTATVLHGKDGSDGQDGKDGSDGQDGKDGYTPVKGVDYFDGEKGDKGDTGATGSAGKDGADGVSVTHSWSGTTLTITSASGTSSADLKGEKGDTGANGKDYVLTSADKEEIAGMVDVETEVADQLDGVKVDIVQEVLAQLGGDANSIFGKVNEDGTITLTTDLAEGEYTLMYENEDGTITEVGTVTIGEVEMFAILRTLNGCTSNKSTTVIKGGSSWTETISANSGYTMSNVTVKMGGVDVTNSVYSGGVINIVEVTGDIVITATATMPNYNNLADPKNEHWKSDTRINSSGVETGVSGVVTTNYFEATKGDIIRVKGLDLLSDSVTYERVIACKGVGTYSGQVNPTTYPNAFTVDENGVITYTLFLNDSGEQLTSSTLTDTTHIRLVGVLTGTAEDVIITVNEEIV